MQDVKQVLIAVIGGVIAGIVLAYLFRREVDQGIRKKTGNLFGL